MALIPYVKIEDCCQELQDRFKARRPLNVSLMIAHSEPVALAGQELGDALMRQAKLSPKLREMAILLNARNCGAHYEWVAHIPAAKASGVSDEQIKAIEGWWRGAEVFSELERSAGRADGYLASITSKIRFGTGVYVLPLRNPFAVAKAVATLDQLSNGRFIFGVGVGWLKEEFEYVGMNWDDRALRSNEYMKLLTALWSEERPTFKGKTVAAEGFFFNPKTVQQPHPPFVIGGHGEAAYKRAARLADGFYATCNDLDEAAQTIRRLREAERGYERAKPLEITMGLGSVTVDEVKRLAEMGVERVIPGRQLTSRDSLGALRRFHDEIMSKCG